MKRRGFILLVVMISILGLTACQTQKTKEEDVPAVVEQENEETGTDESEILPEDETGSEPENPGEGASEPDSDLDNFDADMEEVFAYAASIKEAVAEKDLEKLADLTGFPVYVGLEGVDVVETREAFLELGSDRVISEGMQRSIEKADVQDLSPSMAGFTLMDYDTEGSASITFGMVNGELRITGINYEY